MIWQSHKKCPHNGKLQRRKGNRKGNGNRKAIFAVLSNIIANIVSQPNCCLQVEEKKTRLFLKVYIQGGPKVTKGQFSMKNVECIP